MFPHIVTRVAMGGLIILTALVAACGPSTNQSVVTRHSSTASAPHSTVINGVPEGTVLGGALTAFESKFGQPNDHSLPDSGEFHFQRYSGSNADHYIIRTEVLLGGKYSSIVGDVDDQFPSDLDIPASLTACQPFFPSDAHYVKTVAILDGTTVDGESRIYSSASLAAEFPPKAFADNNGNLVAPGMFEVDFIYDPLMTQVVSQDCEVDLGDPFATMFAGLPPLPTPTPA